jgi:hypothetical protein
VAIIRFYTRISEDNMESIYAIQLHTLQGNTRQATINISTEQRDKENAFQLCRGYFNQHTVLLTGK